MNIPIKDKNNIPIPPVGYGYLFIDYESKELKCKKDNGEIIKFNTGDNIGDINLLDFTDHTAFDVYVSKDTIPVGTIINGVVLENEVGGSYLKHTGSKVYGNYHAFLIRYKKSRTEHDVIVDWGDGTVEKLSDISEESPKLEQTPGTYFSYNDSEWRYVMCHNYKDAGQYTVRVFGKCYDGLVSFISNAKFGETNRICRIFESDLPIASHILNISSWCKRK